MFLSMVIPGPNSPGQNINVFIRPLINNLTQLQSYGVLIYDVSTKQNILMKTVLIWTTIIFHLIERFLVGARMENQLPPSPGDKHFLVKLGLFEIVVAAAVQSAFRLKMHQNDVFYFKKIIFEISTSKRSENIKKLLKKIKI